MNNTAATSKAKLQVTHSLHCYLRTMSYERKLAAAKAKAESSARWEQLARELREEALQALRAGDIAYARDCAAGAVAASAGALARAR